MKSGYSLLAVAFFAFLLTLIPAFASDANAQAVVRQRRGLFGRDVTVVRQNQPQAVVVRGGGAAIVAPQAFIAPRAAFVAPRAAFVAPQAFIAPQSFVAPQAIIGGHGFGAAIVAPQPLIVPRSIIAPQRIIIR